MISKNKYIKPYQIYEVINYWSFKGQFNLDLYLKFLNSEKTYHKSRIKKIKLITTYYE